MPSVTLNNAGGGTGGGGAAGGEGSEGGEGGEGSEGSEGGEGDLRVAHESWQLRIMHRAASFSN